MSLVEHELFNMLSHIEASFYKVWVAKMTSKWLTDEKVDSVFSSVYLTGMLIVTMLTSMITGIISIHMLIKLCNN
jgi:hypothetical protein